MSVNTLLLSLLTCLCFFFVCLPFLRKYDLTRISENQLMMSASYLCAFMFQNNYLVILPSFQTFSPPETALLFGQHQESRPLARSNDIPVLNASETHTLFEKCRGRSSRCCGLASPFTSSLIMGWEGSVAS